MDKMAEDEEPIDDGTYAALREEAFDRVELPPVMADYEEATDLLADAANKSTGVLVGLIAMAMATEREVAVELATHAIEAELLLLGVLTDADLRSGAEALRERLVARIRAVALPPPGHVGAASRKRT